MTPFRLGDIVRVEGDTWFGGATGYVDQVYPSGTLMVELLAYKGIVQNGLTLPFAASELVAISCQHSRLSEAELRHSTELKCTDCHEWVYPFDDGEGLRIYVGEPPGAGADPYNRPDPMAHPEAWTE